MWHGTWRRLVSRERRGKKAFHDLVSTRPFLYTYVHRDTCLESHEPVFVFTFSPFSSLLSSPPSREQREGSVPFEKDARKANYRDPPWVKVSLVFDRPTIGLSFRSFPLRWILRGAEGFESCDFFVARWSATVRQPWIEFVSLRVIVNFYLNWCMNFNRCVRLTFFIDSFAIDRRG